MISIIIPVYNEELNLWPLHNELKHALINIIDSYEIIYINDGSTDASRNILDNIKVNDPGTIVLDLDRHYGQTEAMQAGIDSAAGDILVFMDADLQNDPKDIPRLLLKIDEGYDIVSGWRKNRQDSFFLRKVPSFFANYIFSVISQVKLHDFGCTLKAYRKEVLQDLRLYGEMHRLIPIYAVRQGGRIIEIDVGHRKRIAGKSKYGLMRFFRVMLDFYVADFINGYLNKPMYFFGGYGIGLMFLAFFLGGFICFRKVFLGGEWVSPLLFVVVILFIVSIQFLLMGLIAEILIRIYYQDKQRKTYALRKMV
ncbi:MAG: glycosyltransferase family 2 protein [Candidatus Omnitrophota bacterium]